jgi:potassium efflux system protein
MKSFTIFTTFLLSLCVQSFSQDFENELGQEKIRARISELETNKVLSEDEKKEVKGFLDKALGGVVLAEQYALEAERFAKMSTDLEGQQSANEAKLLAAEKEEFKRSEHEQKTVQELEGELSKAKVSLLALEAKSKKITDEPSRRDGRLAMIPSEIKTSQSAIKLVDETIQELKITTAVDAAQATSLAAVKSELNNKIKLLENEQLAYSSSSKILLQEIDVINLELANAKELTGGLEALVDEKRKEETARLAVEAGIAKLTAKPELASIFEEVEKLASDRQSLAQDIESTRADLSAVKTTLDATKGNFERDQAKVEVAGLGHPSGQLLRRRRSKLASVSELSRNASERTELLKNVTFTQYEYQDSRRDTLDVEEASKQIIAELGIVDDKALENDLRGLLDKKREYIVALSNDYDTYGKLLLELSDSEKQLIDVTREYRSFIDQRVIWIQSTFPLSVSDLAPSADAMKWLVNIENWSNCLNGLRSPSVADLIVKILFFLTVILLFAFRPAIKRRLTVVNQHANRRGLTDFAPTVNAVILTVCLALVWPSILCMLGWSLMKNTSNFSMALGASLLPFAILWFCVDLAIRICRENGLGDMNFNWNRYLVRLTRSTLQWFICVCSPFWLVSVFFLKQDANSLWSTSLGRIAFILFWIFQPLIIYRLVFSPNGMLRQLFVSASGISRWLIRLSGIALVLVPIVIALLAWFGFYETAQILSQKIFQSVLLVLCLVLLNALIKRWLLMRRRRLLLIQRNVLAASAGSSTESEAQEACDVVDVASVSMQSERLLLSFSIFIGFLVAISIWSDVIPALQLLGKGSIWPGTVSLSWFELFISVAIAVISYVAASNIPGLLELTLLSALKIDTGAKYAISTLSRYAIVAIGLILVGATLGLNWDSIQWLVAAMGIGLGFGLQEIFANFISGIILLFERPIRVGDIITLGDTTGTVTRIRIRATTVTDWDRKEFVIPNKDLITGQLLNWTLTDQTNRIVIRVGVAYGSDTRLAMDVLLKVANENELVLSDPAPIATFEEFGDSTLNLVLRCYLPNLENRLSCTTSLYSEINEEFKKANIEIAFPQQDIYIRAMPTAIAQDPGTSQ